MSSLEPRRGSGMSRSDREKRGFQLVVVGGVSAVVAVVGFLLAIVTSFPGSIAFIAAVVAVVCAVMFRRLVSR